jgi:predicted CXXCH cytochrome family protein
VRNLCARCHDKAGPFVFEHVDLSADCQTCHNSHGSPNRDMTRWGQPFLCLQCHQGHNTPRHPGLASGETKEIFFGECTRCHTRIHGTDLPGYRNDDRFTR